LPRNPFWLCLDPGISGTGYAFLEGRKLLRYGNVYPEKEYKTWEQRSSSILIKLRIKLASLAVPNRVYIEWPSQFTGAKGLAAANSNDILKLSCLIGRLAQFFLNGNADVLTVPVQRWKGNLPKDVVAKRKRVRGVFRGPSFLISQLYFATTGRKFHKHGLSNAVLF